MRSGSDRRGSARNRAARKCWMLQTFGTGRMCQCVHCGVWLCFGSVTADRIVPGGSYARSNVQPACMACNRARGDRYLWTPENAR